MHAATTTAKKILKKERHYDASSSATAPYTAVGGRGRSPSSPPPAASVSDGKSTGGNDAKKKHLVWDEHAIEEHDLLRGTRMKVSPSNAHPTPPFPRVFLFRVSLVVCVRRRFRLPNGRHTFGMPRCSSRRKYKQIPERQIVPARRSTNRKLPTRSTSIIPTGNPSPPVAISAPPTRTIRKIEARPTSRPSGATSPRSCRPWRTGGTACRRPPPPRRMRATARTRRRRRSRT